MKSEIGKGTEVILSLPTSPKPKWLAEKLEIEFTKPVMIIDDDTSIHDIWTKKLEDFKVIREDFYTTNDARLALKSGQSKPGLILCDCEFIGQKEVGLQFLESINTLPIQKYLVTTHVDNETILNKCEDLGLQLIPKHLLPYLTIQKLNTETKATLSTELADATLIDDEPYNHEFWQFAAKTQK